MQLGSIVGGRFRVHIARVGGALAALVVLLALGACAGSDSTEPAVDPAAGTAEADSAAESGDDGRQVEPEEGSTDTAVSAQESTQSTGVAPSEENDQEIRELAATFYSDIPPDEFVIDWATKLGASACTVVSVRPEGARLPLFLTLLGDGTHVSNQDLSEPTIAEVITPCFFDAGLEPTADDAALAAISFSPLIAVVEVRRELPSDVLAKLPPDLAEEFPIDFENYSGPVIQDIDGVPTSIFFGEDNASGWHLVTTSLTPDDIATRFIIFHVG